MSVYKAVFEHSAGLTILNSITGICTDVAAEALNLLGYSRDQVVGRLFFEFVPPSSMSEVKTAFIATAASGKPRMVDHTLKTCDGQLRRVRTTFKKIDAETIASWSQDIETEKQLEEAIRTLYIRYDDISPEDFYRGLVSNVAHILRVKFAFIARTADAHNTKVEMLAFWNGNDFGIPFSYDLKGTPCDAVINDAKVCYYPMNVQKIFPNDRDLITLNAQSYVGVPIRGGQRRVIGHLAILDSAPMKLTPREQLILEAFARRAAFMLEQA